MNGRIFKITKEQAGSYELLKAPKMRAARRRLKARSNPGVTTIMGISNPARGARPNTTFPFMPRPGMVLTGGWVIKKVSSSLKRVTIYMPQTRDYGYKMGKPLTFSWDEKMGNWKRQGLPIPAPVAKKNRNSGKVAFTTKDGRKVSFSPGKKATKRPANPGEDSMIVMRKNAARKKPQKKSYRQFSEFVVFPARGKGKRGVSGYAGKSAAVKKKVTKKATKKKTAKANAVYVGPEPKNKKTKAWRQWNGRRLAASRWGVARKKPAAKKAAPAKRRVVKKAAPAKRRVVKKAAPAKRRVVKKAAPAKRRTAKKSTARTVTQLRGRTGALRVRRVSKPGSGSLDYLEIIGGKRVSVKRGATTKRGKTVRTAVRNYNGKPTTWYQNKTKAVANLMRKHARANPDAREAYWAEQAKKTAKPKSRWDAIMDSPAKSPRMTKTQSMADIIKSDSKAAGAAAASGVAPRVFASLEDFEKWFAYMWAKSPGFRTIYNAWKKKMGFARKAKPRTTKKATSKKAPKKMASKAKKTTRRKARTTKAQCRKMRHGSKAYMSCISRLPKRRGKKAAARRPAKSRGRKVAARRPAKARKTVRRRARRNMSMKARANQAFAQVTKLAKPTGILLGGIVVHRMVTALAEKFLNSVVEPKVASVVANLAVLGIGSFASNKVTPANANMLSLGMAASAGMSIIGQLFPQAKEYLGLGVLTEGTRARYVLDGMGQPIMQAAAGMGQPIMQAAAGPMGDYYDPMGEYVSNDLYPSGGDFGEYVASNLDVQGYGDYEVQDTYAMNGGSGYMDDGVRPDGDLGQEFALMEAKAGVGQPIMQAAAGVPDASIYVPSQQAGLVSHSETSYDAGIFDIGGGNGVLS